MRFPVPSKFTMTPSSVRALTEVKKYSVVRRFSRCRIEAVVIMELGRINHRVVLSQ